MKGVCVGMGGMLEEGVFCITADSEDATASLNVPKSSMLIRSVSLTSCSATFVRFSIGTC